MATKPANEPSQLELPCSEGDDQRSSDLCAQWKAADAANSAAIAAWSLGAVGAVIGAFTLLAAWRAAHWARKAAEHTKAGAGAAWVAVAETQKANMIAAKSAKADTAPYLVARPVNADKIRWGETGPSPTPVLFRIENVGRGPAFVTGLYRRWTICEKNEYPAPVTVEH